MPLLAITTPAEFAAAFGVSRETLDRLETYAGLLRDWQKVHNLVSTSTLDVLWQRHMADSAQLLRVAPEVTDTATTWVDLGSGAGFPGLVVAILLSDPERPRPAGAPPPKIHLVEATAKKCDFLRAVAEATRTTVEIHGGRIESLVEKARIASVDVVAARAVAPLVKLLGLAHPLLGPATTCLFPKGRSIEAELADARRRWRFRARLAPSMTDPEARIAVITDLQPRTKR